MVKKEQSDSADSSASPASTPRRSTRLESLSTRPGVISGSSPLSRNVTPSPSARASTPSSGLKFKPKNVARRTKAERDADAPVVKDEPVRAVRSTRGGRGGRGGAAGRGRGKFDNIVTSQAQGPLAAPPAGYGATSGSWGSRGTTSAGFSRVGARDSHSPLIRSQSPQVKTEENEDGTPVSGRSREATVDLHDMHEMAISMGEQLPIPGHIEQYFPIRIDKQDPESVSQTAAGFSSLSVKDSLLNMVEEDSGIDTPKEILEVSRALEQGRYMAPEQVDEARRAVIDSVNISKEFGLGGSDAAELEQKLYLFQLPPIIPSFKAKEEEKEEVEEKDKDKEEDVEIVEETETEETNGLPEGQVGNLRLHKSGKLTMVIGDVVMDVTQGVPAKFLQDIVVCSAEEKQAYLIGQVKRKMVVTPKLDELL
ncbi:DNA-directed RNA polymerase III subunit RPC4 [Yarrowia sp. B02]|nr:DNA-directed RNA polymerase III subunit RPC4 [Yarrowia sp. B02]